MLRNILKFSLSILLLILIDLKGENEIEKEKEFDLGETIITATRTPHILEETPGIISVITEEEIKSVKPVEIKELIEKKSGIKIIQYGGLGSNISLNIRGTTSAQTLILIDGVPINLPSLGVADLNTIPVEIIEKIEIAKGPFSSLYGANALGGVINIITKKPKKEFSLDLSLSYGRWDTTDNYISFGKREDRFGYFFSFGNTYTDGFRENSKNKDINGFGKLIFDMPNGGEITISGIWYNQDYRVPGSITYPTPFASQKVENKYVDVSYNLQENFSIKTYWNSHFTNYKNEDILWPSDDDTENNIFGLEIQKNIIINEKNFLTFGADYKYENANVFDKINNQSKIGEERSRDNYGVFLQDEAIFRNFNLTYGFRWDYNSVYGSFFSPKISSLIKTNDKTNIRFSIGRSYRAPSINELYWYEDWGFGMGLFGNKDLKVEKGDTIDFGIEKILSDNFLSRVNLFYTKTKDLIKWVETAPWKWEAKNIDEAEIKGIETELVFKMNRNFEIGMNYTFTDGKNKKIDKYLTYTPKNKISLILNYKNDKGFKWYTDLNFVDKVYTDEDNTQSLDDYFVLNTTISKEIGGKYEVFLKGINLLDEKYQTVRDYPMPKRQIIGGVKIKF